MKGKQKQYMKVKQMFMSLEVTEKELVVIARGMHVQEKGAEHGIICTLGVTVKASSVVSKKFEWKTLPIGHRSNLFNYTVRLSPPVGYQDSITAYP